MTVGKVREMLENSKEPVYVIQGEDYRFRTYNPIGMSTPWDKLPNALKIIFADFSNRSFFVDCLYEVILDSDDDEPLDEFISRLHLMENNCNLGCLYKPNEPLYFYSASVDDFWFRYPLRIVGEKDRKIYNDEKLIAISNLDKWLKFHPCQRIYLDEYNIDSIKDLTPEETEALSKVETIALYEDEMR